MVTRRIISFGLAAALLVSLLAPVHVVARSCSAAMRRMTAVETPAHTPHGCRGCSKSKEATVNAASVSRTFGLISSSLPTSQHEMVCCNFGTSPSRVSLDVPTLTPAASSASVLLTLVVSIVFGELPSLAVRTAHTYRIGESPPDLAAVHQHAYLLTSAYLI